MKIMYNPVKQLHSDRFIPVRCQSEHKTALTIRLGKKHHQPKQQSLNSHQSKRSQLTFTKSLSTRQQTVLDFLTSLPTSCKTTSNPNQPQIINCTNIIDVPGVIDNFYYNTMDVSHKDFVAVGLGGDLHMFRQADRQLVSFDKRKSTALISCVRFSVADEIIICADQDGVVEVHDVGKVKTLRMFKKHSLRVGRLQTDPMHPSIFYSGSKDYRININDLRQKTAAVSTLTSHKSQICGLTLKDKYLASGSNDGNVKIWDIRSEKLLQTLSHHKGAVKALSWCPWRSNILVSGGGRKDQKLIIYDHNEKLVENTIMVNHQITDICWRTSTQQMIYSYGKQNRGSIRVHNYFNPKCLNKKLSSHVGRVIGIRMNKSRDNILYSLAADESLMYWDLDNMVTKMNARDVMNSNFLFQ